MRSSVYSQSARCLIHSSTLKVLSDIFNPALPRVFTIKVNKLNPDKIITVVNDLLLKLLLDLYQSRYNSIRNSKVHTNTIANIKPDTAQSVFSSISPTDIRQSRTQASHKYYSQYQSGYGSVCILRYLSYRYNSIRNSKVHTNTIANINPDTAQSVFSDICPTDTINLITIYIYLSRK